MVGGQSRSAYCSMSGLRREHFCECTSAQLFYGPSPTTGDDFVVGRSVPPNGGMSLANLTDGAELEKAFIRDSSRGPTAVIQTVRAC